MLYNMYIYIYNMHIHIIYPHTTVLVGLGKRSNCLFYNPIIIKYDFIKVLKYQNQVKGF